MLDTSYNVITPFMGHLNIFSEFIDPKSILCELLPYFLEIGRAHV